MGILEIYKKNQIIPDKENEYNVLKVDETIFVGKDNENVVSVLIKSDAPNIDPFSQKTNLISVDTNVKLNYYTNDEKGEGIFNVIKCYSSEKKDVEVFLKLCDIYFYDNKTTTEKISEVFMTLLSLFAKNKLYSKKELQGLYCELFTIYHFKNDFDFAKYWHSKDYLKFDFALTSKIKLEIKSTMKNERIHRFNHEQLATKLYEVYIMSYKLKYDDCGMSLEELINKTAVLLNRHPEKVKELYKVLYVTSQSDLDEHKYSPEFTIHNLKLYNAKNVPHFEDAEGVSKASYESDFENINYEDINEFLNYIKEKTC